MTDGSVGSAAWTMPPGTWLEGRARSHGAIMRESLHVPVRDGTRLAVDVDRPAAGGPWPAVLVFTPYYRRFALVAGSAADPCPGTGQYRTWFPPFGYAVVCVDTRGTGASFGSRAGMRAPSERLDYHDIVDWVARQPWCSGAVGITGISYVGAAGDFAASTGHPAIRAVMPVSSVWDTWGDMFYPGGLLFTGMLGQYGRMMEALDRDQRGVLAEFPYFSDSGFAGPAPVDGDADGALLAAALREHDANFDMTDFITQLAHRGDALRHDAAFTTETIAPMTYAAGIPAGVAHYGVSGWMDGAGYTAAAIGRFAALPNPARRLLLGPWDHGARTHVSPAHTAGVPPRFELLAETLRFFDQHVMRMDTGLGDERPVHYYTMIEEAWHEADRFPPEGTVLQRWVLGPDGALLPHGAGAAGRDEYVADPSLGTGRHTRFDRIGGQSVPTYYDDWHGRSDAMLRWAGPAAERDSEVTGAPLVDLWLETDVADAAVCLYLEDVAPDGRARYVTEGVLRASCRAVGDAPPSYPHAGPYHPCTRASAEAMPRGKPALLQVAMHSTSWLLRAGHRLRLALAGADRDHLARVPWGVAPRFTVHRGGECVSAVHLPVVPR